MVPKMGFSYLSIASKTGFFASFSYFIPKHRYTSVPKTEKKLGFGYIPSKTGILILLF